MASELKLLANARNEQRSVCLSQIQTKVAPVAWVQQSKAFLSPLFAANEKEVCPHPHPAVREGLLRWGIIR